MKITGLPKIGISASAFGMGLVLAGLLAVNATAGMSGSVEAGYNLNFNGQTANVGHVYDAQARTFTLNNAHLVMNGADSATGLGWDVETDFGTDAALDNTLDFKSGGYINLQEAYLTYGFGPGKMLGLKAGKYATYQGIEVIEGGANPTVTRGNLYAYAEPATHTGLELSWASGMVDVHVGAINGWDIVPDNNDMPSWLAKVGINMGDVLALTISGIIGSETAGATDNMRTSLDVTGVTKKVPMTDSWFQLNYGMEDKAGLAGNAGKDASWLGFGLQPLVHLNDKWGVGLRYEYFMDDGSSRTIGFGAAAVPGSTLKDFTIQNFSIAPTAWITKALMARVEFRMDMASEKVYVDSDKKATDSQMEVAGDLVASF